MIGRLHIYRTFERVKFVPAVSFSCSLFSLFCFRFEWAFYSIDSFSLRTCHNKVLLISFWDFFLSLFPHCAYMHELIKPIVRSGQYNGDSVNEWVSACVSKNIKEVGKEVRRNERNNKAVQSSNYCLLDENVSNDRLSTTTTTKLTKNRTTETLMHDWKRKLHKSEQHDVRFLN